jgi:RimJ/RimL family protein N-acetyltransferase
MENKNTCEIRDYTIENYAKTVEWLNNEELKGLFGITYSVTLASHTQWIEDNPCTEVLPLYFNREYVGNIVLNYTPRHKSAFLQIYIGASNFRGLGLGERFMRMALEYTFNVKHLHRIWLCVREHNEPACRLYSKLGFKVEGLERESIWDGQEFISQRVMSILSQEFRR